MTFLFRLSKTFFVTYVNTSGRYSPAEETSVPLVVFCCVSRLVCLSTCSLHLLLDLLQALLSRSPKWISALSTRQGDPFVIIHPIILSLLQMVVAKGCTLKEEHPLRPLLNLFVYHFNRSEHTYESQCIKLLKNNCHKQSIKRERCIIVWKGNSMFGEILQMYLIESKFLIAGN